MLDYILPGIFIGLSSGFAPGPLMTLVVSQTLRHGLLEGIKVAIAPFLTDIPIVLIITLTLSLFKNINLFLGIISFLGAGYLFYLAYESIKIKGFSIETKDAKPQSIRKGIIANFLNPAPYFFYFTVGGPLILKSLHTNIIFGFLFIGSFLASLVGSKIILAYLTEHSRNLFKSTMYIVINKILGLILAFFAIKFILEGIHYLH